MEVKKFTVRESVVEYFGRDIRVKSYIAGLDRTITRISIPGGGNVDLDNTVAVLHTRNPSSLDSIHDAVVAEVSKFASGLESLFQSDLFKGAQS